MDSVKDSGGVNETQIAGKSSVFPKASPNPVLEQERPVGFISIPFESKLSEINTSPHLPPLQSLIGVEKVEASEPSLETPFFKEEHELGVQFSTHAAEAARALHKVDEALPHGVNPDGSRWWKETGVERRPDGVVCRWTMKRGVSADQAVEWQDKFWEASDELGHKELGSEKSGRDATGNVWREYWTESMWQVSNNLLSNHRGWWSGGIRVSCGVRSQVQLSKWEVLGNRPMDLGTTSVLGGAGVKLWQGRE